MLTNRRQFLQSSAVASALVLAQARPLSAQKTGEHRPNILWIYGEDLSPDLGCYGNTLVHTPNIDRLSREGMLFTNAYAACPVCSPARSALITGMYQTTIGAHNHRSHRGDGYTLPDGVRTIMDHLRDEGYFTANIKTITDKVSGTGKTDFNFQVENPFDGDQWSDLKANQPFYAQVNFSEAHRDFKNDEDNPVDPAEVNIPPYYPDHPISREDWSKYLETVQILDKKVGVVLEQLEKDGLAENTIVVFMADHGRCHPRGKQWLYEGGIHVPLMIRWPGRLLPGSVNHDMVSAIDVTATSLAAAGAQLPVTMQGRDLFRPDYTPRDYIVSARDRCDETVDRIRCVRTQRYKYIRNFMPDRPYLQLNRYKETQYPVLRLMRRMHKTGGLTPAQQHFMAESRPKEELYDLQSDPHEIRNLSERVEMQNKLEELRGVLNHWIAETGDKGEIPEEPAIAEKYEQQMINIYNERLKKLYEEEGMEWRWG